MANLATIEDVADGWRMLTQGEQSVAQTDIASSSADIRLALPDIDARIAAEAEAAALLPEDERTTPLADAVKATVVHAVRRYLRSRDQRDPSQYGGPMVTAAEIDRLRVSYSTGVVPLGSFPDPCPIPVF
jgi:hypothetical protein